MASAVRSGSLQALSGDARQALYRNGAWSLPVIRIVTATVVFVIHAFAAWDATAPVWMDDEVGYLANAQLLSGIGEPRSLGGLGYYSGWSVVLAPIWWIFDDPGQVYRAAVAISVACGVLLIAPLERIARRLGLSPPWAVVVGGAVALAPSRSVMSGYALAENFLTLVVALTVLAALRFSERSTPARAAVLGTLAAYAFFTHGRVISLVGGTFLWFLIGARSRPRAALVGAVTCIFGALMAHLVNSVVIDSIYDATTDREGSAVRALLGLDLTSAALALTGLSWYLLTAWAALPFLGAWFVARRTWSEARARRPAAWTWLSVSGLGVLLVGISSVASAIERGSGRADIYIYGRYVEPVTVLLALVGLVVAVRRISRRFASWWAVVSAAIASVFFLIIEPRFQDDATVMPINIAGLMQWSWDTVDPDAAGHPWLIATVTGLAVVAVLVVSRALPVLLMVVLAVAFAGASVAAETRSLRVFDSPWRGGSHVLADVVRSLDVERVSYDLSGGQSVARNGYQFWLAPQRVPVFRSAEESPPTDVVISRRSWPLAQQLGAEKIMDEPRFDEALWVLPGGLQEELKMLGALLPTAEGGPLPDEALAYSLTVDNLPEEPVRVPRSGGTTLDVVLKHEGAGSPWPALTADGPDIGYVRLVLYWQHREGQLPQIVDLPRSLLPGESISLSVELTPPREIADGLTSVRVGMVQEGVRPFDPAGAEPLAFDVEVHH